jgi:hypothetical protein
MLGIRESDHHLALVLKIFPSDWDNILNIKAGPPTASTRVIRAHLDVGYGDPEK